MSTDFPSFTDGKRAVRSPLVKCYNLLVSAAPRQYHYLGDDIKGSALAIDHILEGVGEHLGGFTGKSLTSGPLNIQLDNADDPTPDVAHVVSLTKGNVEGFYVVREASFPGERNNVVRGSLSLTRIVNPVLTGLLSADEGDTYRHTFSIAGGDEDIDPAPLNHRTGSTKSYSATLSTGAALPAGVTISATTGVITVEAASVSAAVHEIEVLAVDTLANKRTLTGVATLVLTITA